MGGLRLCSCVVLNKNIENNKSKYVLRARESAHGLTRSYFACRSLRINGFYFLSKMYECAVDCSRLRRNKI